MKSIGEAKTIFSQFAGVDVIGAERYEIIEPIGQGGMGIVYKAKDRKLGRIVAIKRLLKGSEGSERAIKRFRQEAKAIASLNHFNIVQIFDIGEDDQGLFISMEYIEGKSLRDKLQREGALSEAEVIDIMIQLCQGLKVAHKRGIIHRDIKPSNILLTEFGTPKLADFGLARVMARTSLSITGIVLGTIDYMSPEQQTDSAKADERSDIYSLGMTMYEMLTGEAPRVVYADKLPPRSRRIILKSTAANPKNRYQVVDEMLIDLQELKTKGVKAEIYSEIAAEEEVSIKCPKCGLLNPRDKMFCLKCGTSITEKCPKCGKDTGLGLTFCGQCGIDIPEYKNKLKAQYTQEGKIHIAEHNFEDAFIKIDKIIELDNKYPAIIELNELIKKEKEKILKNEIDNLTSLFKDAFKNKKIKEAELAYTELIRILPTSHSLEYEFSQFLKIIEDIDSLKSELNQLIQNKNYQSALEIANELLEIITDDDEILEAKKFCSEKIMQIKELKDAAEKQLENENYIDAIQSYNKLLSLIPEDSWLAEKITNYTPLAEGEKIINFIYFHLKEKRIYKAKDIFSDAIYKKIKLPNKRKSMIENTLSEVILAISELENECLRQSKKHNYEKASNFMERISSICIDSEALRKLANKELTAKKRKKIKTKKIVIMRRRIVLAITILIILGGSSFCFFRMYVINDKSLTYIILFSIFYVTFVAFLSYFVSLIKEKLQMLKSVAPKEFREYLDLLKLYKNNFPK